MKFKVGDTVKNVGGLKRNRGKTGKIISIDESRRFPYAINFNDVNFEWYGGYELELVGRHSSAPGIFKISKGMQEYLQSITYPKSHKIDLPKIKKVISNPPTTVVGFTDGTYVKSVATKGDKYDLNKGIMICIMKKMYGLTNTQFRKMFKDIKDNKLIVHKKKIKKGEK